MCFLGSTALLLETPGHSSDSVSLCLDNKICLVGDVIMPTFFSIYPMFLDAPNDITMSWSRLSKANCEKYYPGHGLTVSRKRWLKRFQEISS